MAAEKETEKNDVAALPAPAGKKKMFVIAAVALLVVGIGAPVSYFLLAHSPEPEEVKDAPAVGNMEQPQAVMEGSNDAPEVEEGEEALGAILPLETFLVNLSGGKYIRLQMQVEFETPDVPKKIYSRMVPIRDGIITLLTQQDASELEDVKGKEKLKKSLRELINERLRREDVRRIYFTQFVIQ
jgi:flagellar basal body-associated protein FliL